MRKIAALALATLFLGLAAFAPARAENSGLSAPPCAARIAETERTQGIPTRLLAAISLAESGRYDEGSREIIAWPWTINAEGQGQFFETKAEAIAAVKKLRARGVASIDVGCMQVNLLHHPHAFESLEDAFDPQSNVAYAARFLKGLYADTRSWSQAVAFYHSTTRELNVPYRTKVYRLVAQVWRSDAEKKRQEVIAAFLERRAAYEAEQARRAAKRDPT